MNLDQWLAALSAEIGTEDFTFDNNAIHTVLDLARDAAHEVARPAAPLTTFLVGVAVGRGMPLGAVAAKATALAVHDTPGSPAGTSGTSTAGSSGSSPAAGSGGSPADSSGSQAATGDDLSQR